MPGVSPRTCGAADSVLDPRASVPGSSPRPRGGVFFFLVSYRSSGPFPCVRGNGERPAGPVAAQGLLPALAEAMRPQRQAIGRGGFIPVRAGVMRSDRLRLPQFIPARAGQPDQTPHPREVTRVHPRARGAALAGSTSLGPPSGSSPRARGQPRNRSGFRPFFWVHPRARGAALAICADDPFGDGSSPRVRGSWSSSCSSRDRTGFIPAGAGRRSPEARRGHSGSGPSPCPVALPEETASRIDLGRRDLPRRARGAPAPRVSGSGAGPRNAQGSPSARMILRAISPASLWPARG